MKKSMFLLISLIAVMTTGALAAETPATPPGHPPTAQPAAPTTDKSATPPGHPATDLSAVPTPQNAEPLTGEVLQTMNSGGYSYIYLQKKDGKKVWVAVMDTPVKVGSQMSFKPGMEMANFESKSMKRTFDAIIFSEGPLTKPASDAKAANPTKDQGASPGSKGASAAKEEKISVAKATGSNASTVEGAYLNSTKLDKKKIVVKGKVVKVSVGIMQKNWIHIQDGTGSQAKGTHNLVCTSQDMADVGDIVTVTGTLAKDRDFGGGYRYGAIIEKATFKK